MNRASKETTIMKGFTRVAIILIALLASALARGAQSNDGYDCVDFSQGATGSKNTKVGRANDNRTYEGPPERSGNATRDFPPRPDGAISNP